MNHNHSNQLGWVLAGALLVAGIGACGVVDNSGDTLPEDGVPSRAASGGSASAGLASSGSVSEGPTVTGSGSPSSGGSSTDGNMGSASGGAAAVEAAGGTTTTATGNPAGRGGAPPAVETPNGGAASSAGGTSGSGLPCDVQAFITTKCQACHNVKPPGVLFKSSDFAATSTLDPSKTVAQLALQRIQTTGATRMPPAGLTAATPTEIAAFKTWVDAGAPATACGSTVPVTVPPPNPYGTPVMCSSGSTWRSGEGATMRPGEACINCHSRDEGPAFSIAGTVYPTAHEPNDCNGAGTATGASVVITDKNGQMFTAKVNAAGNFSLSGNIAFPYRAKVVSGDKERAMLATQSSGDCNTCHTQNGANNAPGRIILP